MKGICWVSHYFEKSQVWNLVNPLDGRHKQIHITLLTWVLACSVQGVIENKSTKT